MLVPVPVLGLSQRDSKESCHDREQFCFWLFVAELLV